MTGTFIYFILTVVYVHGVIYGECQMLPRYDGLSPGDCIFTTWQFLFNHRARLWIVFRPQGDCILAEGLLIVFAPHGLILFPVA